MKDPAKKTAFLFPGQGVPAREICEYNKFLQTKDAAKAEKYLNTLQESLDEINPRSKFNAEKILADDSSPAWDRTDFVQPLIYTLSVLTFDLLKGQPSFVMGHSLGAFSAVTASGALPFERGSRIVAARGKFMQEESRKISTGMIAVIGLTADKIEEICKKTNTLIALYNAPTAFVIGCERKDFQEIEDEVKRLGGLKTIILTNAGAFHTKYMEGAYKKFEDYIDQDKFNIPEVPVVLNMKGSASIDPEELKVDLVDSMTDGVNWIRMMNFLKKNNIDSYVEAGPGSSLSIFAKMNGVEREKISHAKDLIKTSP